MFQNIIKKSSVKELGYNFIQNEDIPEGFDEYYLRNYQRDFKGAERNLTAYEIEVLIRNRNTSDNWNNIYVQEEFNPELVKSCSFHGLVRIGKLESICLSFSNLTVSVGLYNSTIISSDFGDNVSVSNVNYLSHYIIGNEVIITNVKELATTNNAKFGNGILKKGETESKLVQLEVCNENGGRSILPFVGMLPGDAFLWSRFRDDEALQQKFKNLTEELFDDKRGYYGKIGDRTVIKNTLVLKDVWIGSDAYIKGANKLKNLTINSGTEGKTQIGEGCELVNGIIEDGCRIFYGAKAVRFVMASHSQLKYGARLINSYLGNNATISCCEVLNSLIYPFHEQHHNNSFLCASLVMGQSNIAAGATIGSNHNSRGADGEIIAGRGFWPGLCVSLKHNSKFASYTIIAKGDFPAEINLKIPFSLISNDAANDKLVIMPAYWFMYNMYALARNTWKYSDRDKRVEKIQHIEVDYLAPDTIQEIIDSMDYMALHAAKNKLGNSVDNETLIKKGHEIIASGKLENDEIILDDVENTKRKVLVVKASQAYNVFKELIVLNTVNCMMNVEKEFNIKEINSYLKKDIAYWLNVGGQLITKNQLSDLVDIVKSENITSWAQVHQQYTLMLSTYSEERLAHSIQALGKIFSLKKISKEQLLDFIDKAVRTNEWMVEGIFNSRSKDYSNPFRKMVYETEAEMNKVLGSLADNSFIAYQNQQLELFKTQVEELKKRIS